MKKIVITVSLITSLCLANCGSDKEVEFILPLKDRNVQDRITKQIVPSPIEKIDIVCMDSYGDLYFNHGLKTYNIDLTYDKYMKLLDGAR